MAMATKDSSSDFLGAPGTKKPYEKPSFRFEQVFVTTALACGKISVTQVTCSGNTKVS